jgi:putative ABC transport system ATP-binding protein
MNVATLSSKNISKSFTTGAITQQVIKDSSIDIYSGELTLMVGPSGSGKSTMLSMLSGLLRPDQGHVFALGTDLWTLDETAIDRFRLEHCGFIFQGFNLFSSLTALENVILPLQYLGITDDDAKKQATNALTEVGMGERSHLRPLELSGGEKQRVAIARALVKSPKLMFADEPTSALDSSNGQIVIDLLKRTAHEHGATVLAVTHDPRLLPHADRVLQLEDGVITKDFRPANQTGSQPLTSEGAIHA